MAAWRRHAGHRATQSAGRKAIFTGGSELFINPLMAQYWTFEAVRVVSNMAYAAELAETERMEDARRVIERSRESLSPRPRRAKPL